MSKSPLGFNFHLNWYPTSIEGVLAPKIRRKCSPSFISQSLNSRTKWTFQILLSCSRCLAKEASTEASLSIAIPYSLGKATWKWWSPYHPSCQKLTLFPNPTTSWVFLLKSSQLIRIPLHRQHPWAPLPNLEVHPPHSSPNFEAIAFLHSRFSYFPNCHNYFPNNALLKVVSFLLPKPPLAMGAQTLSHPTKCVLLSLHRKSLCNFSILLATWVGMVNSDR